MSQLNPIHNLQTYSFKIILILSSRLSLSVKSGLSLYVYLSTTILCAFLISSMCATLTAYLIFTDLITMTIFGADHSDCAVQGLGLDRSNTSDCGFELCAMHGRLSTPFPIVLSCVRLQRCCIELITRPAKCLNEFIVSKIFLSFNGPWGLIPKSLRRRNWCRQQIMKLLIICYFTIRITYSFCSFKYIYICCIIDYYSSKDQHFNGDCHL
jgi:hypothetical protein